MPQPLPELQLAIVKDLVANQGFKPEAIVHMNVEGLEGRGLRWLRWAVKRLKLTDPKRALAVSRAVRLPKDKEPEVLSFLNGDGKDLPAHEAQRLLAEQGLVVSQKTIFRLRAEAPDKPAQRVRRTTPASRLASALSLSASSAKNRYRLYIHLCLVRAAFLRNISGAPDEQICNICNEPWFATPEFYYQRIGEGLSDTCKVCEGEIRALKQRGYSEEEVRQIMGKKLYFLQPQALRSSLLKCRDREIRQCCLSSVQYCWHCGWEWFWNDHYFHKVRAGEKVIRLDVCLACPAVRQFFGK